MPGGKKPSGILIRRIALRGIGNCRFTIANPLADPVIELHGSDGSLILRNDNWRDTQPTEIQNSKLAPESELEPAVIATLQRALTQPS